MTGTVWQSRSRRQAGRERAVGFVPGAAFAVTQDAWRSGGRVRPRLLPVQRGRGPLFAPAPPRVPVAVRSGDGRGPPVGGRDRVGGRSPLYLEHMAATRLRPFRPLAYRLYLAFMHTGYVLLRALRHRTLSRGEGGARRRVPCSGGTQKRSPSSGKDPGGRPDPLCTVDERGLEPETWCNNHLTSSGEGVRFWQSRRASANPRPGGWRKYN